MANGKRNGKNAKASGTAAGLNGNASGVNGNAASGNGNGYGVNGGGAAGFKSGLEKRFFVVARYSNGHFQGCSDSPDEFMGRLESAKLAWVDYLVNDMEKDACNAAEKFGFDKKLVEPLIKNAKSGYEDSDSQLCLKIPAVTVNGLDVVVEPIIVLIRKNIILTIHGGTLQRFFRFRRYAEVYLRKIPRNLTFKDKATLLLCRLIDENNSRNFDHLREIEEQGDEMSKSMMDPNTPRMKLGPEIYKMKHALIVYLDALWATLDVINSLRYGDADLMSDNKRILDRVDLLSKDVTNQIALSEHMSEVLASGLEVLQSIYNNQLQILNNRMAFAMTYLTILGTAVLVPNTIATIMSNPAFNMTPKDEGWYIALILGSTIVSTGLAYWWSKKKGWIPKAVE